MLAYLIRRLFAAAVMLVVIIMVVFCIFFLVPKWAGVDIASSFVGKQADPGAVAAVREKLGLSDPIHAQVWEFFKGIFAGRTYAAGGEVTHCSAPCFGYSFRSEQAVWPVLTDRLPVTLGLALGAAVLWLVVGVAGGCSPRSSGAVCGTAARWSSPSWVSPCRSTSPACSPWRSSPSA